MKSNQSNHAVFPALLSGLLLGLSVNHAFGISLAFLFPVCLIGIFATLEKQANWKYWLLNGYVFSFASLSLALIGFIWVEPFAGSLMVAIASLAYTIPVLLLYAIRRRLRTDSGWSFLILALLWPPFAWFIKELLLGFPITLFANGLANYPVFIQFIDITGYSGISAWVITLNVCVFHLYKAFLKNEFSNLHRNNQLIKLIAATVIWFALPLLYAWYAYSVLPGTFQGSVKVAVIQSEYSEPDPEADKEAVFPILNTTLALTDSVIAQSQPDLVVWPEGALPARVRSDVNSLIFITDRGNDRSIYFRIRYSNDTASAGAQFLQSIPKLIPGYMLNYTGNDHYKINQAKS